MRTFRLSPTPTASRAAIITTTSVGPFLVDAVDELAARMLVGLNYSIAVQRAQQAAEVPSIIWRDAAHSECREVFPPANDAWLQRHIVAGIDMAGWYIEQAELVRPVTGLVARLRWWPCAPDETCPV